MYNGLLSANLKEFQDEAFNYFADGLTSAKEPHFTF